MKTSAMKRWTWSGPLLIVFLLGACAWASAAGGGVITPQLAQKMDASDPDELIRIYIIMKRQVDRAELEGSAKSLDKALRRQLVIDRLIEVAEETQAGVLSLLEKEKANGKVDRIRTIWLGNTIACKATKEVIQQVSTMPDVNYINYDKRMRVLHETGQERRARLLQKVTHSDPEVDQAAAFSTHPEENGMVSFGSKEIVWGVTKIKADSVWALGYTGNGIIVSNLDTGINYNHLDLRDHMWDGTGVGMPNHGYDFADDDLDPMDEDGHGTHTAGTIAGDGTAGSQVGVAPDATIMAMRVIGGGGKGFETDCWYAMQYSLSWGADVLSMSAGYPHEYADLCNWRIKCDQLLAAGVIFATSAGNGDNMGGHYTIPNDISAPANIPAPWYPLPDSGDEHHSSIIAVGATYANDFICTFSSRGPTEWAVTICGENDYDDYNYPPGLLKPEVCAPGYNVKSLDYADTAGYVGGAEWSGTSMSCPHVSGTLALMLEKNPSLTPVEMDRILEITAVELGPAGRDSLYGAGRIDALAAVIATPSYGQPPDAISDLAADLSDGAKSSSGDIFLSWTEPGSDLGVDYYVVYRATDPEAAMDSLGSTSDTVYTDSGAAGDTLVQYYYTVRAVDTGGQQSSSSNTVGEFDTYLPTAP